MTYSKLHYGDYLDNLDFWRGAGVEAPRWADEIAAAGGEPVCAIDFYDDIFGDDLEPSRMPEDYRTGEYGAIAIEIERATKDGKKQNRGHRYTVTQGNTELYDLIDRTECDCHIAPISYAGRSRSNKNARYMYALCIEIDNIEQKHGIKELFYTFRRDVRPVPRPTYIVCSGNGLHLYWKFERPIPLFRNVFVQLQEIKKYITRQVWDKQVSNSWQHIQFESLCQPFRCVGTCGKDRKKRAMAFKVGDDLTIESFNARLPESLRMNVIYKSNLTLTQAREMYPEWYRRRILEGKAKGHYNRHEGIYHNWIEKICDTDKGAEVGHRYNCLENLCSLAVQCQIEPEQVEKDCRRVAEHMESLTVDEDNHFTEYDILCALRTYHTASEGAYHRRLDVITNKTGIALTPTKRNGRSQADHIKLMNFVRDEINGNKNWREGNGRPEKMKIVLDWRREHPDGKKAGCIRDTGLSKPTVLKWWEPAGEKLKYEEQDRKVYEDAHRYMWSVLEDSEDENY